MIEPHEGEEFGYVLAGRILLYRESAKKGLSLKKGDNFCMSGKEAHWLENKGSQPAAVLWISTPPIF